MLLGYANIILTPKHVASASRRQVQNVIQFETFKIEFHYFNWNPHGRRIHISTSMPGIGLVLREIREINFDNFANTILCGRTNGRMLGGRCGQTTGPTCHQNVEILGF